ncbi:MAG: hypothetical protein IPI31_00035 [Bacteroidetes bacterium]|nr:hypothetical protein [Bacteroidota bacterium]
MKEKNIYIPLWQKYKPVILTMMRKALDTPCEYQLSKYEFEAIGERIKAGYAFKLEFANGRVINNIEGTAVARDLVQVLKASNTANILLKENNYKINMGKDFKIKIVQFHKF